jgi:hypothetical protein
VEIYSFCRWYYWVCQVYPLSIITRNHDVSETGFISTLKWKYGEAHIQLGPSERASLLIQRLVALSNWPNWKVPPKLLNWGQKYIQLPKRCVHSEYQWTMSRNTLIPIVIYHLHSPTLRIYSLSADHTENTASNISSIVACWSIAAETFTAPFPSNDHFTYSTIPAFNGHVTIHM